MTVKPEIICGTALVILANISASSVLTTIILAAIGALVSSVVSRLMRKWLDKNS